MTISAHICRVPISGERPSAGSDGREADPVGAAAGFRPPPRPPGGPSAPRAGTGPRRPGPSGWVTQGSHKAPRRSFLPPSARRPPWQRSAARHPCVRRARLAVPAPLQVHHAEVPRPGPSQHRARRRRQREPVAGSATSPRWARRSEQLGYSGGATEQERRRDDQVDEPIAAVHRGVPGSGGRGPYQFQRPASCSTAPAARPR